MIFDVDGTDGLPALPEGTASGGTAQEGTLPEEIPLQEAGSSVPVPEAADVYRASFLPYAMIFGVLFGMYLVRMLLHFVGSALFVRFKEKQG